MEFKKYVFTGPMRSGKSTLIKAVSSKIQTYTMAEVPQYLIDMEKNCKKPESEWIVPWNKPNFYKFQQNVFKKQAEWEKDMEKNCKFEIALMDRSLIDGKAYLKLEKLRGLKGCDELDTEICNAAKEKKYEQIFMCEFIKKPDSIDKPREDLNNAGIISDLIWSAYRGFGYMPIFIPDTSIEKRVEMDLEYIK